ncbi:bifunctional hydroxymethylpyrimidine kinase/phosphomethylpyrimidine kinase [Silvibacterium sp.]|uniref:bifunctional hydroxymethylpyrimidine kinase/phosphomethylpyrimidine kinase n=1 Tax=Silvibacterium sp. TaxID=1964179 RepID=UPI0039E4E771
MRQREENRAVVLSIAGFDPSSGAGITSDLKVFAAHRLYGVSAITALTVQSTQGVRRVEPVAAQTLTEILACLAEDGPIAGVKIGMLGAAANVQAVVDFLASAGVERRSVVLDPVIRSSSGRALLDAEGVRLLESRLLELVGWVTPNVAELGMLAASAGEPQAEVLAAAKALVGRHPGLRVVATDGEADPPNDLLWTAEQGARWFPGEHIETTATHGTGCAFSSSLLAGVVMGLEDAAAVQSAKAYVREAMLAAYPVGRGRGPLHHLYAFDVARDGGLY